MDERERLRAAGFSEREIDEHMKKSQPPRGAGPIRAAAQGATFGLGEEAEALAKSLLPGRTYGEEVSKIRSEMARYREAYPKEALAAETAGGLAVPGLGAFKLGKAAVSGGRLMRAATSPAGAGVIQGALAGAGATEGGAADRLAGAVGGGVTGGVLGGTVGALTGAATRTALRGGKVRAPAGVGSVAEDMAAANITPQELARRAASAPAGATVADIIGEPAVRTLRGIRAAGGKAGRQVSEAMEERVATSPERLRKGLYGARAQENVVDELEQSIRRGTEESKPLYQAFEQEPPKAIPEIDAVLRTPFGQEVMARARRNAANEGRQFIEAAVPEQAGPLVDAMGQPIMQKATPAKYNPKALDDIKKAMDDIIYEGRMRGVEPGQGGITPGEVRIAKKIRSQFVNAIDEAYPDTYAEARAIWGGEAAFREALEDGRALAKKSGLSPEEIAKQMREYDVGDIEAVQRGYIDEMRQRIESEKLSYREVNTEAFAKRIKAILGPEEGQRVTDAFRAEGRLMGAARTISGGSQTADKAVDLAKLGGSDILSFLSQGGVRRGLYAAGREAFRQAGVPLAEKRQMEAARALLSRPSGIGEILDALSAEERIQRRGRAVGDILGGVAAREGGTTIARESNAKRYGMY